MVYLQGQVLGTTNRAFQASRIKRELEGESEDRKRKIKDIFFKMIDDNYYMFDDEDPFEEIQSIGLFFCKLYKNPSTVYDFFDFQMNY